VLPLRRVILEDEGLAQTLAAPHEAPLAGVAPTAMRSSLSGKTVLITGASGAVGQACLETFLHAGANVMMTDRAAPPTIGQGNVAFQMADVTDRQAVAAVFEAAVQRFGRVDAAVLAAGIEGAVGRIEDVSEADVDAALAVNVKGVLFWMQALLPHMKSTGGGSIVALSSISGMVGAASLSPYAISKHAVIGLVRTAALEAGRHGVRVNAVCPGPIESDMMRRLDKALSQQDPNRAAGQADAARAIPLQRYATPRDVAKMIAFLCSDDAASCHGGAYMVDGGFTAR
jgi:NAD(P)-dependent dehydrogenase (short-subunit alcohol dehydrogenase family)